MDPTTSQKKSLAKDSSGAIMVMGVFMAVVLVGFMYYLIGIGETIAYRERMQDAADAGAWAAAITHAHGMNAIVLINMIMAALVAVLLAIKIILFLIHVGMVVSGILCAIPWTSEIGCPIETFLSDVEPTVKDVHDEVQNIVKEVVPLLNKVESAIAIATPILAEAKAIKAMGEYSPPVDSGLSGVMIPAALDPRLPVEDDQCSVLEDKAKGYLSGLATGGVDIPVLSAIMGAIIGVVSDAAIAVEGSVCGNGSGAGTSGLVNGKAMCEQQKEEEGCNGDDPPDACDSVDCDSIASDSDSSHEGSVSGSDAGSTDGMAPKKVKDDCNLGGSCLQLRTVAFGTPNFDQTMTGVQYGNFGHSDGGGGGAYDVLQTLAKGSVAQAEYYWDAKDEGDGQSMREDWMWKMRWRARLRRFRLPTDSIFSSACSGGGGFCGAVSGASDMINNVIVH